MMPAVQIRPAERADLPAVLRLYNQPDLDQGQGLDLAAAHALYEKMQCYPSYRIFVAARDGEIVGTFTLLIMDNLLHRGQPSAIVEAVAVAPPWQSQGIGRSMMQWAMAESARANCYKLMLSSNWRRDRAHAFYDSLGFTRHGYSFVVALPPPCPSVPEMS